MRDQKIRISSSSLQIDFKFLVCFIILFYSSTVLQIQQQALQNDENVIITPQKQEDQIEQIRMFINTNFDKNKQIGEKGNYFYIILKGSVGMYIQKRDQITDEIDPYSFEKIRHIPQGKAFGELSLVSGKPSVVLAKCETNCHFAVLSKNRYKNLLSIGGIKYLLNEIGFLNSLPYLNSFNEKLVKHLFLKRDIITFHKGQVVYQEGSTVDDVYIVKLGEFNKMKKVTNQPEEIETYWQLPPNEISVNQRKVITTKIPPKQSNVQIGVIMQKDLIGELEILKNLRRRQFTLTCYSHEGQLMRIPRKVFQEILISDDQDKKYLLDRVDKILQMEGTLMERSKNGALFNHFFSFENVYKQNRVQSKTNVLDESPLPKTNSSLASPRLQFSNQLFSSRKASLITEPLHTPIANSELFLSKKNSITSSTIQTFSPKKTSQQSLFYPSLENDHKLIISDHKLNNYENKLNKNDYNQNLNDRIPVLNLKDNQKHSLQNRKMSSLFHIQIQNTETSEIISSPLRKQKYTPMKNKHLNLKLKIKTEESIDKRLEEIRVSLTKNKSQTHLNVNDDEEENKRDSLNEDESISPQRVNAYFQKSKYQPNAASNTNHQDTINTNREVHQNQIRLTSVNSLNSGSKLTPSHSQQQNHRSIFQNEDYFTQTLAKTYDNSMFPTPSEFNPTSFRASDQNIIRHNKKSMTSFGMIPSSNGFLQPEQQWKIKDNMKAEVFVRKSKKNKTVANEHIDPFVKMFHKRLQYNFFQQYGKVDMHNLKAHVMNDALKQLPDCDSNIPSLTDIRVLIDEYLSYKNKQDIQKINQKYIQSSSNLKPIKQSQSTSNISSQFSHGNVHNLNKTQENDSSSQSPLQSKMQKENVETEKQPSNPSQPQSDENNLNSSEVVTKVVKRQSNQISESNFNRKLGYLKQITNDFKQESTSHQKYIQLGQSSSIMIKSLTKLPERELSKTFNGFKRDINICTLQSFDRHVEKPYISYSTQKINIIASSKQANEYDLNDYNSTKSQSQSQFIQKLQQKNKDAEQKQIEEIKKKKQRVIHI